MQTEMAPHESKHPEEGGHVQGGFANEAYVEVDETKSVGEPSSISEGYPDVKDPDINDPDEDSVFQSPQFLDDMESDSPGCGWFDLRPGFIQRFNNAKGYLFFICLFTLAKGMGAEGLVYVTLTTLEQRYHLSSTQSALITSAFQISLVVFILLITYFAEKSHKPRILGTGSLIFGVGSVIFTLPHYLSGNYEPHTAYEDDTCKINQTSAMAGGGGGGGYCGAADVAETYWIFYAAQVLHGMGAAGLYTLNMAYLDENVKQRNVAVYIGIFQATIMVAPAIGYVVGGGFLTLYADIRVDPSSVGLSPHSPLWIGNWWLPFLIPAGMCFLLFFPIVGFPRRLPGFIRVRQRRISQSQKGSHYAPPSGWHNKAMDFPRATWNLIKNIPFMFLNISVTAEKFVLYGFYVFGPKYLESQFNLTAGEAASYLGILEIPATLFGCLCSGYLIRHKHLDFGGQLKLCKIVIVIAMMSFLAFFIRCPNANLAGVNVMYKNTNLSCVGDDHGGDLIDICNEQCHCPSSFDPVCGSNGVMYYSPCHAGCTDKLEINENEGFSIFAASTVGDEDWYANCSCIEQHGDEPSTAVPGKCDVSCPGLGWFLFVVFIAFCSFSFAAVPHYTMILSCVGVTQRAYALAIHSVMYRLLGTVPGPIAFGALIDKTCLIWEAGCNGEGASSCLMYDNHLMAVYFFTMCFTFKGIALLFSFGAMCWYKQEDIDTREVMNDEKADVEESDFTDVKELVVGINSAGVDGDAKLDKESNDEKEAGKMNAKSVNLDAKIGSEFTDMKEDKSKARSGYAKVDSEFTDAKEIKSITSNDLKGDAIVDHEFADAKEDKDINSNTVSVNTEVDHEFADTKADKDINSNAVNRDAKDYKEFTDAKEDKDVNSNVVNGDAEVDREIADVKDVNITSNYMNGNAEIAFTDMKEDKGVKSNSKNYDVKVDMPDE